jgi:iron complex transport system ATP-binding protein
VGDGAVIEARDVRVEIGRAVLLAGASLAVAAGEVVAVVGANGAGKSTLRRALAGDVAPSAGSVSLGGRPISDWPRDELARVRAVLPQDSSLSFPFTALEVAAMGRMPHARGGESPRDAAIARDALELVEADHLAARLYPTLSGGERQRVQLARVLAQVWEPHASGARYLLLDEPTSSLDLAHQYLTLATARRFADEGAGVLVVLHDLNLAARYADRVAMMKAGAVVAAGPPDEVLTTERILDTFGMRVLVVPHPDTGGPLVIPRP